MFELTDTSLFNDIKKILAIKRKPNKSIKFMADHYLIGGLVG